MDAQPELALLARVLEEHGLEAVLIGNLAAALHGAPVSTVDIDFCFRSTRPNIAKLRAIARTLDAMMLRPHYPVSSLFRLQRESDGLQIDFIRSKQAAGRPKDRAVLEVLEQALHEEEQGNGKKLLRGAQARK